MYNMFLMIYIFIREKVELIRVFFILMYGFLIYLSFVKG